MKKCVKCKLEFNDEFTFCPECGSKLEKKNDKLDLFEDFNDSENTDLSNLDDLFNLDNAVYNDNNINFDSLDNDLVMQAELAFAKGDYTKAKKIYTKLLEDTNYSLDILEKYIKLISLNYTKLDYSFIPLIIKAESSKEFAKQEKSKSLFFEYCYQYKLLLINNFKIQLKKLYIQKNDNEAIILLNKYIEEKKQEEMLALLKLAEERKRLEEEELARKKEEKRLKELREFEKKALNFKETPPKEGYSLNTTFFGKYNNKQLKWFCISLSPYYSLLICATTLNQIKFNDDNYELEYESSSIRKYLNNDFYNNCFSKEEKEVILKNSSLDNVFLLHNYEFKKYFNGRIEKKFLQSTWSSDTRKFFSSSDPSNNSYYINAVLLNNNDDDTLNENKYAGFCPCILVKKYKDIYLPDEYISYKLEYEKKLEGFKENLKLIKKEEKEIDNQLILFKYKKIKNTYHILGLSNIGKETENLDLVIPALTGFYVEINESAFEEMQNIISVTFNNKLTILNNKIFYNCHNLKKVTLNDTITHIGMHCFEGTNIKEIDFKNVKEIGDYAFANTQLESLTITKNIKYFNMTAFQDCKSLTNICSLNENYYIHENTIIYFLNNSAYASLIGGPYKNNELDILEDIKGRKVHSIEKNAFKNNKYIENVCFSKCISKIGEMAFENCTNLKSIRGFTNELENIGSSAFENCINLKKVKGLVNCHASMNSRAFYGCKSLKKICINSHSFYLQKHCFISYVFEKYTIVKEK